MDQQNKPNITALNKGLYLDKSLVDSPKGTYRFALNSVNETELGDFGFISNEESNTIFESLSPGYIPLGKVYIGDNKILIFSVSEDNSISEIGILDTDNSSYEIHVNDSTSTLKQKLGFKKEFQIQATYRLRRGCEHTVYFTDGLNQPRYFNISKPEQFKTSNNWDSFKFSLFKKLSTFPTIDRVEVLDNTGSLLPGSYTILVQHLDEDLNGTEFYELVKDINIYNDALSDIYSDIDGSSNIKDDSGTYLYDKTNKAIKITLDNVDKNFSYIRFAFVERTSGNGQISRVTYSDTISSYNPIYIYTGENGSENGTIEEVELFNQNSGIQSAKHVDQIDNMLILANTTGEQAFMCKLQKYASLINVDCFVQDTILTSIKDQHNSKNPLASYYGVGYQPGEIYSLGIQYIFEDYSTSPVMHIPGKSSLVANNYIFSPGANVYPMNNTSNRNTSELYIDENSSCSDLNYWGTDSQGIILRNTNVRHHRFPTRDEIGVGFVERIDSTGGTVQYQNIQLTILGSVKVSNDTLEPPYVAPNFTLTVRYKRNGVDEYFQDSIYPDSGIKPSIVSGNIYLADDVITDIQLFYQEIGSEIEEEILLVDGISELQDNNLTYTVSEVNSTDNNISYTYKAPIFGLKLSNISFPTEEEIGKKVIGYQIVRQERTDQDKTILDSAVVFPMQKSGRNVSTGLLAPEFLTYSYGPESSCQGSEDGTYPTCYNISKRNIMLVTPGHKFMDKTYDGFTNIKQVGKFTKESTARSAVSIQNVYDGTSASGGEDKKTDDSDGFSLRHGFRFTGVEYSDVSGGLNITNINTRMYNLQAVNYADTEDSQETLYNLSSDNKALILSSTQSGVDLTTYGPTKKEFPYVYITKDSQTFYQGFKNNPYYLTSTKVFNTSTCRVFGGDTYISPLRYSNHIFGNVGVALRRKKVSAWALIGSIVVALIGAALAIFSGGSSLILSGGIILALGAVATGSAAIVEADKFNELYGEKWQANLDKTVFDYYYARLFIREHPNTNQPDYNPDPLYQPWADDTFRWWGEIVGDLWFETPLNISLRVPPKSMENNYLKPLKSYMGDKTQQLYSISGTEYISNSSIGSGRFRRYLDPSVDPGMVEEWYFIKKITKPDSSRSSGLKYQGVSTPQIYLVNPDHYITTGIKKFYAIPLEYDCCSDCIEKFPHRIHYSNQSFQEEKSDNYRVFLAQNYRDIEGETGEITNIFRWYNNLFAHTEEALWKMSRKFQERITDEVVSFIGSGSYFEVPPVKIIDDDTGSSAGTQHKWSAIKTQNGYFFVSANQRKIFQFDGKRLIPISDTGLSNWFKNNLKINSEGVWDNPSNLEGTGYVSTYDSIKERIIFTKKDNDFSWTISYSLKYKSWVSWHSYLPNMYFNTPNKFLSWKQGNSNIWIHNVLGNYQTYYGIFYPHIIEYVSLSNPLMTKIWNNLSLQTEAKTYSQDLETYTDERYVTFNKIVLYNTRQCSGLLNLEVKPSDLGGVKFLSNQIKNWDKSQSIVDRRERDWYINMFRDIRVDYTQPIWNSNISRSSSYIDKELNENSIDFNKSWNQQESFRDKYLGIRLIFDKFADKKLITNYSIESEDPSNH